MKTTFEIPDDILRTMKLPDVNIWLALTLSQHSHHHAARAGLDAEEEKASLCFCRATRQGLVRPLTNREAREVYEHVMEDERVTFLHELDSDGHHEQRLFPVRRAEPGRCESEMSFPWYASSKNSGAMAQGRAGAFETCHARLEGQRPGFKSAWGITHSRR